MIKPILVLSLLFPPTFVAAETELETVQRVMSVSSEKAEKILERLNSVIKAIEPSLKRFKSLTYALANQDLGYNLTLCSMAVGVTALAGGRCRIAVGLQRSADQIIPLVRIDSALTLGFGAAVTLALIKDRRLKQPFTELTTQEPLATQLGFLVAVEEGELDSVYKAKGWGLGVLGHHDAVLINSDMPLRFVKFKNKALEASFLAAVNLLAHIATNVSGLNASHPQMKVSFLQQAIVEFNQEVEILERAVIESSSYEGYASIPVGIDLNDNGIFKSAVSLLTAGDQAHAIVKDLEQIATLPKNDPSGCRAILTL